MSMNMSCLKIPYDLYGISSYSELSDIPQVDYTFKKNGIEIPIFKTTRIIGTIIAKMNFILRQPFLPLKRCCYNQNG